jgi:UDP-glucuronate 4-epimerase
MTEARFSNARFVVTGAAGFVGHGVCKALLSQGARVWGVDNLCRRYYHEKLKALRLDELKREERFSFAQADIADPEAMGRVMAEAQPTHIVHLAADAAVMPSFDDPITYARTNMIGTQVMLEAARAQQGLRHLVYASTSSVYGRSKDDQPFREDQVLRSPVSVYGASKIANEAMAQAYFDRYEMPMTGLRFFKVYGPWARPDTVFFKFTDNIYRGKPVRLHNHGRISHAFTYIDDIVGGVLGAIEKPPSPGPGAVHPVYNLGNPSSIPLGDCVDLIERFLGREANRELVPLPPGDRTYSRADISAAGRDLGFEIRTPIETGLENFVRWYEEVCAPLPHSLLI